MACCVQDIRIRVTPYLVLVPYSFAVQRGTTYHRGGRTVKIAVMERTSPLSPLSSDNHVFASYQRVLRGKDTIESLVQLFQAVEQKLLTSSSPTTLPLADHERRRLLDFPDADEEAENIKRTGTSRSREELLSAAISNPYVLSYEEVRLVGNDFWSDDRAMRFLALDIMMNANLGNAEAKTTEERIDRVHKAADSIHHELKACSNARNALRAD
ncbi:hypothetical protein V8F06_004753 [Rhypophila decipiens]